MLSDFGFGTLYEIECKGSDPKEAKKLIEEIGIFSGKLERENEWNESFSEVKQIGWVEDFTLMAFW